MYCPNNCKYLKPTETEQTPEKEPHWCLKYDKQVLHKWHHPKLLRLDECLEDLKKENMEL